MRQTFFLFFLVFTFFSSLHALPSGNPANGEVIQDGFFTSPATWAHFRIGYEGDLVLDEKMKQTNNSSESISRFHRDSNSGFLVMSIYNRFDVFGLLGEERIKTDWIINNTSTFSRIELETKYHLGWAAGAKCVLFDWGKTSLGVGGRYHVCHPTILWLTQDGIPQDLNDSKIKFYSWQVDLGVSHKIDMFIPYIGAKYSYKKATIDRLPNVQITNNESDLTMEGKRRFGMVLGCSLTSKKIFSLNLEVRLVDEEAVTVSGEVKF